MSRGRQRNDIFLAIDDGRAEIAHVSEITRNAVGALAAGVGRSAAQRMALDSRRGP